MECHWELGQLEGSGMRYVAKNEKIITVNDRSNLQLRSPAINFSSLLLFSRWLSACRSDLDFHDIFESIVEIGLGVVGPGARRHDRRFTNCMWSIISSLRYIKRPCMLKPVNRLDGSVSGVELVKRRSKPLKPTKVIATVRDKVKFITKANSLVW